MATARTRYANTDVSGGAADGTSLANAYSSLSALEAAEDDLGNLVSRDEWLDVRAYASAGTADTTKCTIAGWTLDGTRYIQIDSPDGSYKLEVSNDDALVIQCTNIKFKRIRGTITSGDSTNDIFFDGSYVAAAATCEIDRCYVYASGSTVFTVFSFTDSDFTFYIRSSISESVSTGRGHYHVANTGYIYQCTHKGGASGFRSGTSGTYTLTNDIFFSTADDIIVGAGSTVNTLNCGTDDGDGTNPIDAVDDDWSNEFTDYANGDYTPLNSGNIYQAGADLDIAADYAGNAFDSSTPTIGAYEYVSASSDTELTVADIDIGLDVALDANPLTAAAQLSIDDIDIGLDVAMDAPDIIYYTLGDTVLVVDDVSIGLDVAMDALVLTSASTLSVNNIDIGLEIIFDEVPDADKPVSVSLTATVKSITVSASVEQITIEAVEV